MQKVALISIFCGVLFTGCKAKSTPALPPNRLFFLINKDGHKLDDSILNSIKLTYFDKGGGKISAPPANLDDKSFIFPANRYSPSLEGMGILASGYVASIVSTDGVNTMYLEYPDGDIDTLYLEVTDIGSEAGANDRCYCKLPFTIVRFNGKTAPELENLKADDGKPIFLFEKN